MNLAPLSLDVIMDRIASACPTFASVQEAISSVAAADAGQFRSPGAFVLDPSEQPFGDPDGSGGVIIQPIMLTVTVLTGVLDMRDALAAPNAAIARQARLELRSALLGWAPFGIGTMPLQMGVSQPFGFRDTTYWFLDSFRLMRRLRAP